MKPGCPMCGKAMVKEYSDYVLDSYPPIHTFRWWCGCGARGEWEQERELTTEQLLKRAWEQANRDEAGQ